MSLSDDIVYIFHIMEIMKKPSRTMTYTNYNYLLILIYSTHLLYFALFG